MDFRMLQARSMRPRSDVTSSSQVNQARVIFWKAPVAGRQRIPGLRRPVTMKGFGDELLDYITGQCSIL